MMYANTLAKYLVLLFTCLILISCNGDEVTGTGQDEVHGTAADTAVLQNSNVSLRDKTGATATTTTDEQGAFKFDVAELTPPYLLKAETGSGPLYSIATSAGVANISPLSDVVVRNWFSVNGSDIDNVFASQDENLALPTATEINNLVAAISNLISTVYTSFHLRPNYDFIHGEVGSDFLDMLANTTVTLENNQLSITIITPEPKSVSILTAFNFSDDLSDDSTIAPSQPEGLSATAAPDALQLMWNVSRDNVGVDYYSIYRNDQINGIYDFQYYSAIAHYSDTGLESGTQYCYKVEAVDASERISPISSPYCAKTTSCNNSYDMEFIIIDDSIELSSYWATQVDPSDTNVKYSWTLDTKPDDSLYEMDPVAAQAASFTFIPDVIGDYEISVAVSAESLPCTDAGGSWDITVTPPLAPPEFLPIHNNQTVFVDTEMSMYVRAKDPDDDLLYYSAKLANGYSLSAIGAGFRYALLGDVNDDGVVDTTDKDLLRDAIGTDNPRTDLNNDGVVNIIDKVLMRNNFGNTTADGTMVGLFEWTPNTNTIQQGQTYKVEFSVTDRVNDPVTTTVDLSVE